MRLPAGVVPAERYLADTTAKSSPWSTPTRSLDPGVRAQTTYSTDPDGDLGLLSMVMGDTPGLEVWDIPSRSWFSIEKTYQQPSASLLAGRQLERLTNFRYRAGGHQVRSYGVSPSPSPPSQPSGPKGPKYRYSIVFVLRAHGPVTIDTDNLTTPITGDFQTPIKGITAGQMFEHIRSSHFNINTNVEERDKQKRKLAESKQRAASAKGSG